MAMQLLAVGQSYSVIAVLDQVSECQRVERFGCQASNVTIGHVHCLDG